MVLETWVTLIVRKCLGDYYILRKLYYLADYNQSGHSHKCRLCLYFIKEKRTGDIVIRNEWQENEQRKSTIDRLPLSRELCWCDLHWYDAEDSLHTGKFNFTCKVCIRWLLTFDHSDNELKFFVRKSKTIPTGKSGYIFGPEDEPISVA